MQGDGRLAGAAAQYAAETLQAKGRAATRGENIVDAEAARVLGADSARVASEGRLAKPAAAAAGGAGSLYTKQCSKPITLEMC